MTVSISESTKSGSAAARADLRLDRSAIEAAIRGNLFLASYGDVPAVNGVTVAAEAIVALADMQAAAVWQALEEARDLLLDQANKERMP